MNVVELAQRVVASPPDARWQGYVWWCGDDWCDCYQATIEHRTPNPIDRRWAIVDTAWQGGFYTGDEGDEHSTAVLELRRAHALLHAERPAAARRVEWSPS